MKYLVFYLYGPMASWGNIAVGGARVSHAYPTKSAIMGMLAAAKGIRRDQESELQLLEKNLGFAVRLEVGGQLMIDYHTTQAPTQQALKKHPHATRRDELMVDDLATILSQREYYCDAFYTIVLWARGKEILLEELTSNLTSPVYAPYLGRKSCPMSLPIFSYECEASTIEEALRLYDSAPIPRDIREILHPLLNSNKKKKTVQLYADSDGTLENHEYTITRRDALFNRSRWQYKERDEKVSFLTKEKGE